MPRIPAFPRHARALRICLSIFLGLAFFGARPAVSAEPPGCDTSTLKAARLGSISDALDISLDTGEILRLAGIDTVSGSQTALLQALRAGLPGGSIVQYTAGNVQDRWGRVAAQLYLPPERAGLPPDWVQGVIVAKGLARIWPEQFANPCWAALARTEALARQERRGLWAAGDTAELITDKEKVAAAEGSRSILRGRVIGTGQGRATIFVNFGRFNSGAASLRIPRRLAQDLQQAGIDAVQLRGKSLRIRGVVTVGKQVFIAITQAEQIELE